MDAYAGATLKEPHLTLLGDGAHTVDLLGYQPYADAMVEVLAQASLQTPFTVSVFGRWGTGKSTFMNLLHQQISIAERKKDGQPGGFHAVRFQPWQFEDKEEVWKALLLSVIRYLESVESKRKTRGEHEAARIRATLSEMALSVGKLALDKAIRSITSGVVSLDAVLSAYASTAEDNSIFINTFREKFSSLKDDVLGNGGGDATARLFVFVDDLDRCTPDNCIMVLEAIKLFFDLPECVFVLGIDREVVQRGIEIKYRDSLRIRGQDYIDKIVQLPFSLPPVHEDTFAGFVNAVTADFDFSDDIRGLIATAADSNPRTAKRLSNCLQLTKTVAERLMSESEAPHRIASFHPAKLALLLTLQVRYPVIYRWLTRNPQGLGPLNEPTLAREPDGALRPLIDTLTESFDERTATARLHGFHALWHRARALGIEPFGDAEEMQFYMRLTGIVDEDRAREEARHEPAFGMDADADYVIEREKHPQAGAEETEAEDPDPAPDETGARRGTKAVRRQISADLQEEVIRIRQRWEAFERITVVNAAWRLPGMLRVGAGIVDDARALRDRAAEHGCADEADALELSTAMHRLDGVTRARMYRHAGSVASTFALLWPVAVGVLGGALELALETAWPQDAFRPEAIERILQFGFSHIGEVAVLEFPHLFPGGLAFFWVALLCTLLAGATCVRVLVRTALPIGRARG